MQLSETINAFAVEVVIEPSVDGTNMLALWCNSKGIGVDKTQAVKLLPILEHFIKTGELPE